MRKIYLILGLAFIFMLSCENHLEMVLPQGPQGEQGDKGDKGEDGLSAFELWKILYDKDPDTSMEDFFNSLRGKDGKDGAVPVIGENGNWVIDGTDTGIPATGKDGKDGVTPVIGENDNWFIDGVDTGVPARGKDGKDGNTPVIGGNGNWFIDGDDTGVPARGKDGKDGIDGITPQVGGNGNWFIDGKDTGVPATGNDGKDGIDGVTPSIGPNGNWFIDDEDTGVPAAGKDGANGISPTIGDNGNWYIGDVDTEVPAAGKDGIDGSDGVSPTIGENGNWYINGQDTGVKAEGVDGNDGKNAPIPVIGVNGNWYIDGVDTGKPARGANGIDGINPHIGENGNWYIGEVDTEVPATGPQGPIGPAGQNGTTPTIGGNGNWFIDGVDTGKPARGQAGSDGNDGVDGKSTYELWKDGVDKGTIINKDGSKYEGDNSWESFLKWLQGGDISVLHQHWLSLGNTGDLDAFIEALFDCHCDGISIAVVADNPCIELNSDGSVAKTYNAKLIVSAEAGTEVKASVEGGQSFTKTVPTGQSQVEFDFARGDDNKTVTILAKPSGETEQVTKIAQIPALKYIKLNSFSVDKVSGEEKDVASVTFETAPKEVRINGNVIFENGAIVDGSTWEVSNEGKTFTKTFDRIASVQKLSVRASGDNQECSTITNLLVIPQLTPVTVDGEPTVEVGECDVTVTLTGTTGMTVLATASNDQPNPKIMTESPDGTYKVTFDRKYQSYSIDILASKPGAGNVSKTVQIDAEKLLPNPFTYSFVGGGTSDTFNPEATGSFTNTTGNPIFLEITRSTNTIGTAEERSPWVEGSPGIESTKEVIVAADETVDLKFHRDVAPNFANGNYTVTIKTTSQCGELFSRTHKIYNQRDFNYGFERQTETPGGYPGPGGGIGGTAPWDPDYGVPVEKEGYTIFEVTVTDAIPGSFVQFMLQTSDGYRSVWGGGKVTDEDGNLKILVQMKDSDIELANGTQGEFRFSKEKVSNTFFHTKTIPFNLPLL